MTDAATIVLAVCGGIGTVTTALGIIWWLLKPRIQEWAEEQIIKPVRETHHQVTVNHHSSDEPTVLDKLSDLSGAVECLDRAVRGAVEENVAQNNAIRRLDTTVTALTTVLDEHLSGRGEVGDRPDLD